MDADERALAEALGITKLLPSPQLLKRKRS